MLHFDYDFKAQDDHRLTLRPEITNNGIKMGHGQYVFTSDIICPYQSFH